MDIRATTFHDYISFKYEGKSLPIISEIKSIEKIIQGIYEYKFN